jgi:ribonuclease HI
VHRVRHVYGEQLVRPRRSARLERADARNEGNERADALANRGVEEVRGR